MRALYLLPAVSLTSCSLLEPFTPINPAGGVPQTPVDVLTTQGPEVVADALSGNYIGAAIGAGSMVAALLGYKGFGWLKKGVAQAPPGKVFVPPAPAPKAK